MISSLRLAEICGVTQGTVDRALHNRPGINPATRRRILAAARRHGYAPHPAVGELLRGTCNNLIALVPKFNGHFFMDLVTAIQEGTHTLGYRLILGAVSDEGGSLETLREFAARRFPAAVIIPPVDNLKIPPPLAGSIKIISLLSPCRGKGTFFITPDEEQTGRDAVNLFVSRGHRNILHLTFRRQAYALSARQRGYEKEMTAQGLKPFALQQPGDPELIAVIRRANITALFCHNDWLALSAMRILERHGLKTPEDISVLGVDNSPSFTALFPDITTLEYPFGWIREQVVNVLCGKKPDITPPKFKLIERNTVKTI
jgi:LacI family transcriptional regulator